LAQASARTEQAEQIARKQQQEKAQFMSNFEVKIDKLNEMINTLNEQLSKSQAQIAQKDLTFLEQQKKIAQLVSSIEEQKQKINTIVQSAAQQAASSQEQDSFLQTLNNEYSALLANFDKSQQYNQQLE